LPGESGSDLVKMITRELVDWYVYKEFERSVAKKQQKKVSQKAKKTVDKSSK
jgi:aminoglycoside/choline kinase family phosphotransferase